VLYRLTDRYGEYGWGFVGCTDRMTDMMSVVACLRVVQIM
jgi:hypothetical protein